MANELTKQLRGMRNQEPWALHDTIQIGNHMSGDRTDEGYVSYAALADSEFIALFSSKRKRTTVGPAYSSMDLDGQTSFGFKAHSLGVLFTAPLAGSAGSISDPLDGFESLMFEGELPKHVGVIMKIGQDEKLVTTAMYCPAGIGVSGTAQIDESPGFQTLSAASMGAPILANRWKFPEPLLIPRNTIFSIELYVSQWAKGFLRAFKGPGDYDFKLANGDPYTPAVAKNALIHGGLIGKRRRKLPGAL